MTDIEKKAMELVNEVANKFCREIAEARFNDVCAALYLSIEQHEADKAAHKSTIDGILQSHQAFRQEVSDAVVEFYGSRHYAIGEPLSEFIIAKPDPLVELVKDLYLSDEYADRIRAALDALGLEIREKNDD
jgi:hypothetical protein